MSEKEKKSPTIFSIIKEAITKQQLKKFGPCSYELDERFRKESEKKK